MSRRQTFKELCHFRGEAVVDLISRSPQRIPSRFRHSVDLQHGVVRRNLLKGDVCMPAHRGKAAGVAELVGEPTSLLLLLAADYADLVAQFAALFRQGVDM